MTPLSVRRKADRERMVRLLKEVLRGAAVTLREELRGPREIILRLNTPCGALCFVDFDGDSPQPGIWLVTWNTSRRMAPHFGLVNEFHGCKASRVFTSFQHLCDGLRDDVARFADGSAYADAPLT